METIIQDLGNNCIYGFTETWLKDIDDEKLWQLHNDRFKTFRFDRMSEQEKCGGWVMLVVPKFLNPKLRKDLNHTNLINFESMWIECNISRPYHQEKATH